jgi:hypothetical protein
MKMKKNGEVIIRSEKDSLISYGDVLQCPSCNHTVIDEKNLTIPLGGTQIEMKRGVLLNDIH